MNRKVILPALVLALLLTAAPALAGGLTDALPAPGEAGSWKQDIEPQVVAGENLFELINGGAEDFLKHGFKQALDVSYVDPGGRTINVQIYEMNDDNAARAVFNEKTAPAGAPVSIGDDARLEEYFLGFIKGPYYVTLTGYDTETETTEGLKALAGAIADRLGK